MLKRLTIRLAPDLAEWLKGSATKEGTSQAELVRAVLQRARESDEIPKFTRLAGAVRRPRELSSHKGFSRP